MTKLLQYSGISAKIRAMQSRLFTPAQYETLKTMGSVSEALGYLKQLPSYAPFLQNLEESQAHRGQIEAVLTASLYDDFSRLYRFGNVQQRKFMDFYFKSLYPIEGLGKAFHPQMILSTSWPLKKYFNQNIPRISSCIRLN